MLGLEWERKKTHLHPWGEEKKNGEWQKSVGWRKESSNGRERSGMLSLPLRGQVWTTIKTEFHLQPSGNSLHITHKGQDICYHPQLCAHVRTDTHTHVFPHTRHIFMRLLPGWNKQTTVMPPLNMRPWGCLKWIINAITFPTILVLPLQDQPKNKKTQTWL